MAARSWLIFFSGLLAGGVALAAMLFLVLAVVFDDTSDRCYRTYGEAKAEQASDLPGVPKGWMPAFLPTDAYDICMWMDLDTGLVIIDYRYETAPFAAVDAVAVPIPPASEIPFLDDSELKYGEITEAYVIDSPDESFALVADNRGRSALLWNKLN